MPAHRIHHNSSSAMQHAASDRLPKHRNRKTNDPPAQQTGRKQPSGRRLCKRVPGIPIEIRHRRPAAYPTLARLPPGSGALARRPTGASLMQARVPDIPIEIRHRRPAAYPTLARLPPGSGALARRPTGASLMQARPSDPMRAGKWRALQERPGIRRAAEPSVQPPRTRTR